MSDPQTTDDMAAIMPAAKAGDAQAQFQLALRFFQINEQDEFLHWLQQSADQDFPPALLRLGIWQLRWGATSEQFSAAKALVEKAANLGFVNAIKAMAVITARGAGALPNWAQAMVWFKKALQMNEPSTLREAGLLLMHNEDNKQVSRALLAHSAVQGDILAYYHLGMLLVEFEADEDVGKGIFWLTQAQAQGHVLAGKALQSFEVKKGAPPKTSLPPLSWPDIEERLSAITEPSQRPAEKLVLKRPRTQCIKGVLTPWECDYLIGRGSPLLTPATTSESLEQGEDHSDYRTNTTAKLGPIHQDMITAYIERKMALAAEAPLDHGEDFAVLNYKPGERYYPHYDSFLVDLPGHAIEIEQKGQRIRTCLVYLNDDFDGGETHFVNAKKKIRCEIGEALVFDNVSADGEPDLEALHEGVPVTAGEKWLATKWFRDKSQVVP